jgi:hypothetical protein
MLNSIVSRQSSVSTHHAQREGPVICAGNGVLSRLYGSDLLLRLAEKSLAPVATTGTDRQDHICMLNSIVSRQSSVSTHHAQREGMSFVETTALSAGLSVLLSALGMGSCLGCMGLTFCCASQKSLWLLSHDGSCRGLWHAIGCEKFCLGGRLSRRSEQILPMRAENQ